MEFKNTLLLTLAVLSFTPLVAAEDTSKPPNILFVLTDDQGWTSLGCYGNRHVATPNLDRLAEQGMRLTDAYVMPQCTPTRAALLTGQHTARNQMWHVIGWYGSPWARVSEPMFREHLDPSQCRLPQQLREAGYRTGMAGKWHLTNNRHGFYTYLRQPSGDTFGFDDVAPPGEGSQNEGDKWVDHLTDAACEFMRANRDRPWFYYLAHHTLHNKVSAPPELVQKHRDRGAPEVGLQNATYLAAIEHLDNSVGRLMQQLDELELADNTLFVFLSDNGGIKNQYNLPEWDGSPLSGSVPLTVKEQQFDNAPLREGKGSVYEGGIRVPCIVRWPGVVHPGTVSNTPIHIVDWYPTLCRVAGVELGEPTDGINLMPVFKDQSVPERSLFWYMPLYDLRWASTPSAVIRRGEWKLIHYFGDWYDSAQAYHIGAHSELYDLADDLGETRNLAKTHPQRASQLRDELLQWVRDMGAEVPALNPHYDPSKALKETKDKQPWNR
ncbi:sulfatase [Rhodopirellula sp. JC639]|uniref:sulfatase n=1 Tax=Stieleria mannarensis TaxID=2755585 RepID=UPI0015FFAEBA|nr:sulfatase [Rhodopirellula sp. JC639]